MGWAKDGNEADRELSLTELEALYSSLSAVARDPLLQERLTAALNGRLAMMEVPEAWLLDRVVRDTIEGL